MISTPAYNLAADPRTAAALSLKEAVLKLLAYFDIFHYPLTRDEVCSFLRHFPAEEKIDQSLAILLDEKTIFCYQGFYSLQDNLLLVHRRKQGNERAVPLLRKAIRIGRFLQQFPFVRAVGISGSLSKNFAAENADIDFFIITASNRLWIARTLMHLFKKLCYLAGRQHYFCMNYYIDEMALSLEDQNIFSAIEVKTLVPVDGFHGMEDFFTLNAWTAQWLPGFADPLQSLPDSRPSVFKNTGEWFFNAMWGDRLDDFLFHKTRQRWLVKEARGLRNQKGVRMGLVTGKHFARSNPGAFQERVLAMYEKKLQQLNLLR
ncbi:MAG TPA: hypothetical protein VFX58_14890 [Chitinophagaceae bacterium]|nr:hypothetical protein [Chitinophagaceae bacterium]